MAESREKETQISSMRLVPEIPVIFADGAISQNWGPGVSRFYLGRYDADPEAVKDPTSVTVAQVIMPVDGFVSMVAFFEHRLRIMIERGIVTQESLDKARVFWLDEGKQ